MLQRLFIADNDVALQEVLDMYFTSIGVEVEAESDADALFNFSAARPDVVLLSHCRRFDGIAACYQLLQLPATSRIPIVVMSVHKSAKLPALHAGAMAFIEKPFDLDILQATLAELAAGSTKPLKKH